jgi:hypothetical protein
MPRERGARAMDFEKLGYFYLGRVFDPERGEPRAEPVLYDSKDLTTHAVIVGMTGSGKTGLGVALLEEAALDGIPAIAIDPKGDLGNLLLAFPELGPRDFRPWVDSAEAARAGLSADELAARTAERWRDGLAEWGEDGERVRRFRASAEAALYTPGSESGRPLRALRSLAAPPAALAEDADALRDRVEAAVASLLALVGVEGDPLQSREHVLLANLVDRAWREGRDLELGALVQAIQHSPFERLGVVDLEAFFPARERFELALKLNHLLASPGFAAWMSGEPLDVGRLLYTETGRPRLSVISIAHLSERERMFFVTLLLSEVLAWVRAQPGTSSLRAILYMDEIFGFFPPSAMPPSKPPMLTLLKQARAFGLGVVLATQNPVDLDYKGLANAGTWFVGRLQTERDKARLLDGLEGAAAASGVGADRAALDRLLSGLGKRVFLMQNAHDDAPVLLQTRWTLSYLRGPLAREEIRALAQAARGAVGEPEAASAERTASGGRSPLAGAAPPADGAPPVLPPGVPVRVAAVVRPAPPGARLAYRPALFASARLRYADRAAELDRWERVHALVPLADPAPADPWDAGELLAAPPALADAPEPRGAYAALPAEAARPASYARWARALGPGLKRRCRLELFRAPGLRRVSRPGQSEAEFRVELAQAAREQRDREVEKLRARFAPQLARLEDRLRTARARVESERDQHSQRRLETAVSVGATVLGALFGRKLGSATTVGRAATAARGAGRLARERADVARAEDRLETLEAELQALQARFDAEAEALGGRVEASALDVEAHPLAPREVDAAPDAVTLVWTPWWVAPDGSVQRAF